MGDVGGYVDNTLGTNIFGQNANDKAVGMQNAATQEANQRLTDAYNQQKDYLNPSYQAGMSAMSGMQNLASGDFAQNMQNDAGYKFRLNEGNKAINSAAAARGMGNSGATMKALASYGQDFASNEYDKAYNRQFNTLSTLAGYGQNATSGLVNAAGSHGSNLSNNITGLGNAQASAQIAKGNQQSNAIQQGAQMYAMFSDERLKADIEEISNEDLAEMKSHLKAFAFKYKNELHGEGEWTGVMAQDLQKSKLGKTLVFEDENGHLQINKNKVLSLFLATMAEG